MAMNKYMHPRNIYKTPPNFKQLAIEFPEFRKYCTQDITGKVKIDFKDVNALRALSCTLLKKDFDLDVTIPPNKLIPTIPLRLNYLLWIEDLLSISPVDTQIKGIDIGTGASCVWPLMAAKKLGWLMLATEIADDSIESARDNVNRNNLEHLVEVRKVDDEIVLTKTVKETENFDFCMCNPPFFSTTQELNPNFKARNLSRPKPRNAFCAHLNEVVVHGGEIEFISKIIDESKKLQDKIRIYTTMIGHKSSLSPLKKLLRDHEVVSFKQTEFCQGHTTRWGLAWTFCNIDLRKIPEATVIAARKEKHKTPIYFDLDVKNDSVTVDDIGTKVKEIFETLLISYKEIRHSKNVIGYNIKALSNTWSHQRRKKREEKRRLSILNSSSLSTNSSETNNGTELLEDCKLEKFEIIEAESLETGTESKNLSSSLSPTNPEFENTCNLFAELGVKPISSKRELDEENEYYCSKKLKTKSPEKEKCFLEALVCLRHEKGQFSFELSWIDGSANKDVLHQVLQHFKNNLKV